VGSKSLPIQEPSWKASNLSRGRPEFQRRTAELSPAVAAVIAAVLARSPNASRRYFGHNRLGDVYRCYMISQVVDSCDRAQARGSEPSGEAAARILCEYGLADEAAGKWIQLYEHICGVAAAAVTIATRMRLTEADCEKVRIGALLHDATKRKDVEKHGLLACSEGHRDTSLEFSMLRAGYSEESICAAVNTGREDRRFESQTERHRSVSAKGIIPAIVALADARTPVIPGADFVSLARAQDYYLRRKPDLESQDFFSNHWPSYYRAVEYYLRRRSPWLDLNISNKDIYQETIFPAVFGASVSRRTCELYAYDALALMMGMERIPRLAALRIDSFQA